MKRLFISFILCFIGGLLHTENEIFLEHNNISHDIVSIPQKLNNNGDADDDYIVININKNGDKYRFGQLAIYVDNEGRGFDGSTYHDGTASTLVRGILSGVANLIEVLSDDYPNVNWPNLIRVELYRVGIYVFT